MKLLVFVSSLLAGMAVVFGEEWSNYPSPVVNTEQPQPRLFVPHV
ncbi:unnamed protein product, partial [Plutella xylostella]